jgi:hypothetical protein
MKAKRVAQVYGPNGSVAGNARMSAGARLCAAMKLLEVRPGR